MRTNGVKYKVESTGSITSQEQLKALQDDMRKLPNFGGRAHVCDNITNRDFWALLRDRVTGELSGYFGSQTSFKTWLGLINVDEVRIRSVGRLGNPTLIQ